MLVHLPVGVPQVRHVNGQFQPERRNAVCPILGLDEIGGISFEVLIHNSDSAK